MSKEIHTTIGLQYVTLDTKDNSVFIEDMDCESHNTISLSSKDVEDFIEFYLKNKGEGYE